MTVGSINEGRTAFTFSVSGSQGQNGGAVPSVFLLSH